ncbi:PspC domain-containing protein [Streptomyces sp. GMY02]|uniref:PspC domain-containing protein n=1 Tax=Streptomyces sp. GMY02 TaxID=1333528 RepID=UPI001C2BD6FB|nr:PspC domain-containing protein [Streptomyces sp. GMY02]QXE35144.1 PspC domain-containing protein [Streptomyces sp. GMY02]
MTQPSAQSPPDPRTAPPAAGPSSPDASAAGATAAGTSGAGNGGTSGAGSAGTSGAGGAGPADDATAPQLQRSQRQKVIAGVCGGLGRYCDVDPVIFRIVIGVLSVTGGIGLIFYGFAWLLIPQEGQEENEARRLLSGRVDGASLIAVLMALIGCALFLSMLGNDGTLGFAAMLSTAVVGSAVWSQRRRAAAPHGSVLDPATAQAVAEAPPETMAPPVPGLHSWWRDPIVKDGTTGPASAQTYLWGPEDTEADTDRRWQPWHHMGWHGMGWHGMGLWHHMGRSAQERQARPSGPRGIGGSVLLLALMAGGLGTGLSWQSRPFGTSLQIGLTAALAVFGLGLAVSAFLGRTGIGTVFLTVVTAVLLAGATAVPKNITTEWGRQHWIPVSEAAVKPRYELGSGVGTLDLTRLTVPRGRTVSTSAEVGAGQLKVVVPQGVTVKLRAQAGLGDVRLPGDPPNDVDIAPDQSRQRTLTPRAGSAPAGTLDLRLEVGLGQVEVTRAAS